MMNELIVPDALSRLDVEAEEALGEEIVPGAVAAVVVRRGSVEGNVEVAELLVGAHERPDADLSRERPGVFRPGFVSELSRLRYGVELPLQLSGARIEAPQESGNLLLLDVVGGDRRGNDHRVANDERRRLDRVGERVQPVALAPHRARKPSHQVDAALLAEVERESARLGIDADQIPVSRSPEDPSFIPLRPISHSALVPPCGHCRRARLVTLGVVDPESFTGACVDRRTN